MKKIIVFLFLLTIILIQINEEKNILIPKDSIRFRIIANSDSKNDQKIKLSIKSEVEQELYDLVSEATDIQQARLIIENNIEKVDTILRKYNIDYSINYGENYFPEKEYNGVKYNEGYYESLVIKIGDGIGKNWWCVLFPPLCKLDNDKNIKNKEYKFFVKDIINKFN